MNLDLRGKAAIVTGASRGIGAAIAIELGAEGCDVALAARSREGLDATAKQLPTRTLVHSADLRTLAAPAELVEASLAAFGRIDLVVCNAGTAQRGDFLTLPETAWDDGFSLKFHAHRRLVAAAWPHLVKSRGSVVFISGVGGRTPSAEFTIGGSVNAAILALSKALAERGLDDGVRVNVLSPGGIATERLHKRIATLREKEGLSAAEAEARLLEDLGTRRFGDPKDVAAMVAFLASGRATHVQGALIALDGGQTKTI
jgi:NAD(P)-dependent dehydrogenase (short-subunit alcohol dehydrogenase family)